METQTKRDGPKSDFAGLERRVLAHERILHSLIVYLSRTEPQFFEHLETRLVGTISTTHREQACAAVDNYAEELIRAVNSLGETCIGPASKVSNSETAAKRPTIKPVQDWVQVPTATGELDRVRVRERDGIWEVRVDGVFLGNYKKTEHARAAAALARLWLK